MKFINQIADPDFIGGFVAIRNIQIHNSSPELKAEIQELIQNRLSHPFPETKKAAVRDLLRRGGFSPSGRNKPCNEYLVNAALEARFPEINNLVDVCNALSLDTGLPLCVQDLGATGTDIVLRYGRAGEKYVFNSPGQEIDLNGLICVCRADGEESIPLSNPIKDSMRGKITANTQDVLGIVYGTRSLVSEDELKKILARFQAMWLKHAGGTLEGTYIV